MEPKLNSKLNSKIVNKKFLKLKSLTLLEALVSITIISLLLYKNNLLLYSLS